jgi:hypothetical protein
MDMVMDEKAAAMNPEKASFMGTAIHNLHPAPPNVSDASMPGAFRVGSAQLHSERRGSRGSFSSESSGSYVVIIPRACLVEDDIGVEEIPIMIADETVDSIGSVAAKPRSRKSRIFRLSVLACLFLIVVLLAGLLIVLLGRDESSSFPSPSPDPAKPSRFDADGPKGYNGAGQGQP